MTEFEKAVVEEVRRIRSVLQSHEELNMFHFEIRAGGRVHDGEVKIEFAVGKYSGTVLASSIDAALFEFARREGFDRRNNGLLLTGPGEVKYDDDLPF